MKFVLRVANEEIVDSASEQDPFSFVQGMGFVLPAFEAQLEGKKVGDSFDFTLFTEEAYGPYSADYILDFPRMDLAEVPPNQMRIGEVLPMEDSLGAPLWAEILELNDSLVKLDYNHPFAGMNLHYSGTILEVRPATPEEKDSLYWQTAFDNY